MTRRPVELQRDTRRPGQRHLPSTSVRGGEAEEGRISGRRGAGSGGGGGGGRRDSGRRGILPKRMKYHGSGHHRPDVFLSDHGRKKLA